MAFPFAAASPVLVFRYEWNFMRKKEEERGHQAGEKSETSNAEDKLV